jgi:hypothetical protein
MVDFIQISMKITWFRLHFDQLSFVLTCRLGCLGDFDLFMLNWPESTLFFVYKISYNIFMLYHYNSTIALDVWTIISFIMVKSNMLLNANLCMSFVDTKQAICHGLWWNYNDVEVDITWKSKVGEH